MQFQAAISEGGHRPKSTLSERLIEQNNRGNMYIHNSASKNSSSQKKQRPGSNFIQKSTSKNQSHSQQHYGGSVTSHQPPHSFSSAHSVQSAENRHPSSTKKSKPPASAGAMTPGSNVAHARMNNSMSHSEHYRQQKAQQRLENMEIGYSP